MRFVFLGAICSGVLFLSPSLSMAQLHSHVHGHEQTINRRVTVYRFGARSHTERLAKELWDDVNAVCWEAHNHYQQEPSWTETYRNMRSMLDDTQHLGQLVAQNYHRQNHADEDHIKKDLQDMDRLMHHIELSIVHWHPHVYDNHDQRDHYYATRGGLKSRVARLGETIHHLMKDYGVASAFAAPNGPNANGPNANGPNSQRIFQGGTAPPANIQPSNAFGGNSPSSPFPGSGAPGPGLPSVTPPPVQSPSGF